MVTYQFEIDDEAWRRWKDTVPRSKNLDERLRELVILDAKGRVDGDVDATVADPSDTDPSPTAKPQNDPRVSPEPDVDRDELRDELSGSGERLEARVDAIVEMYALLRREGGATKGDLLEAVDSDAVGYSGPGSVWANMVKGKDTLRALPGVEPPPSGLSEWRYVEVVE